jgi:murein DD-endopeptidase MepM/ murein hydrolase activator NlpD
MARWCPSWMGSAISDLVSGPPDPGPDPRRAAGNHVVMDHGEGVFSCLAHLKAGSVEVAPGHPVVQGQTLGELGSSGNAFGPHLHLHFMDGPDLVEAAPLPVLLTAEGQTQAPQAGQILGND